MPIRVEVQNLGTLEFPDETPDTVIDATVKRELAANQSPPEGPTPETRSTPMPRPERSTLGGIGYGIKRGFETLGHGALEATQSFWQGPGTVARAVGVPENYNIFERLAGMAEPPAEWAPRDIYEKINAGAGQAAVAIPEIMSGAKVLGTPTRAMAALGGVKGYREGGAKGAATGAAQGALMGGVLKGTNLLPKVYGVPAAGAAFSAPSAMQGAPAEDVAADFITGAGMQALGPAPTREQFRNRNAPAQPIVTITPEIARSLAEQERAFDIEQGTAQEGRPMPLPVRQMAEANAAPAPKAPPPMPGGVRLPLEEYRRRAQAQIDAERPLPAPIQAMAAATNVPQPAPRPVAPDVAMGRAVGQSRRLAQETIDNGAPVQVPPPPKGFNPPLSEQARIPRAPAPRPEPPVVTPPVQNVTPVGESPQAQPVPPAPLELKPTPAGEPPITTGDFVKSKVVGSVTGFVEGEGTIGTKKIPAYKVRTADGKLTTILKEDTALVAPADPTAHAEMIAEKYGTPRQAPMGKSSGDVTLGMGLGVLGEKPVEKLKEAGAGLVEAGKEVFKSTVLTPEREAKAREGAANLHRVASDYTVPLKYRLKEPESKHVAKLADQAIVRGDQRAHQEEWRIESFLKGLKKQRKPLTEAEDKQATDVVEGKFQTNNPRVLGLVKLARDYWGRTGQEGEALGRAGELKITQPSGKRTPFKALGPDYAKRMLTQEARETLGRNITKFYDEVAEQVSAETGARPSYNELLHPNAKMRGAIDEAAEAVLKEWEANKEAFHPITRQALGWMTKRYGIRPWQALRAMGEGTVEDIRVKRAGSLEYARTAYEMPPELYERRLSELLRASIRDDVPRLEVIKAFGQDNQRIKPLLDAVKRKNKAEYDDALKHVVEITTGTFNRGKGRHPVTKAMDAISGWAYFSKIGGGLSEAANLVQPGVSSIPRYGVKALGWAGKKLARDPAFRRMLQGWGVNAPSITRITMGYDAEGLMARTTEKLCKVKGFTGINRFNNLLDAAMALHKLQNMVDIARRGKSLIPGRVRYAANYLRDMNLDLNRDVGTTGKLKNNATVAEIAFRSARDTQLWPDPLKEPLKAADKDTRSLYTLKRFAPKQALRVMGDLHAEYNRHPAAVGVYALRLAIGSAIGGEFVIQAKHLLNKFIRDGLYQAGIVGTPAADEWFKRHDESNVVLALIDMWAAAGTMGMMTDTFRPDRDGNLSLWQVSKNVAFNILPFAVGETTRAGNLLLRDIPRKPSKKAIEEYGETGAWARNAGGEMWKFAKRSFPAARTFEAPPEDKKDTGSPVLMPHKSHSGRAPRPRFGAGGD